MCVEIVLCPAVCQPEAYFSAFDGVCQKAGHNQNNVWHEDKPETAVAKSRFAH
ncbi:MAG: hypothetical protein HFE62_06330 [Firmicutes bacterium]|nr:hypothetical protein [Bacillota bacterium]